MHRLLLLAMCAALPGCGDNLPIEWPPGVDAGTPTSPVADAATPDAWHAPPDAPEGEVCDYLPGTFNEEIMANYPVRFGKGQGLEISPDIRQTGLLELENAHVGNRDVIEKRRGAAQLGDSRSTTPGDDVPDDDRRAIWARGDEVILETHDSIYREQKAVDTFTWSRVASWMRMRLREMYANTFSTTIVSADAAVLGDATLVAYQPTGGDATLAIYSGMAREAVQTFTTGSVRPRLSSEGNRLRVSYVDSARAIQTATYTAGAASVTPVPIGFTLALGRLFWDVNSVQLDTGVRVTGWVGTPSSATATVLLQWDAGAGALTYGITIPGAFIPVTEDVAVSIWPLTSAGTFRVLSAVHVINTAVGPNQHNVIYQIDDINITTGARTTVYNVITLLSAPTDFGRAVAVSWENRDTVWLAVEQDDGATRKVTYYRSASGAAATSQVVHRATTLKSQGVIGTGTPSNAAGTTLSPLFVEQPISGSTAAPMPIQDIMRSGWFAFAPRTGEIVARSFVGFTGDGQTKAARPPKGSLVVTDDIIAWGGPAAVPSEPGTNLRAIAVCKLDRSARANKVAVLDDTAVSAHAGYPRAYDGTTAFEHDWHTMPHITGAPVTIAGGPTTNGAHFFAVTMESDDANGLRYRSAPFFFPGPQTLGGNLLSYSVAVEAFTHTERQNVRYVIWMTEVGLPTFRRAAEAAVTGADQTIVFAIEDGSSGLGAREALDQAPVAAGEGILPSEPARVTDFVSLLIDRLASRDPRVGSLMTFTIPSREASGFSAHWSSSNVIQESLERDITSAIELNGRIFMASESGFSELQGDGPDATGNGTFGTPLTRFVPIGIEDHSITERTPLGYAFGSINGPRLMSLAGTVEHIEEAVERQYEINGGHTVAIAFDENREEIVFLDDSAQTLRLNTHNGRWASDSNRLGRDITVTRSGDLYLLRSDGKVLRQSEDVYADGADGYSTTIAFRLRAPSRDGVAHGGFNFNGLELFGEYLGSHAITVTVTLDFRDSSVILQGEVPAARVVQNAADGRDYRYAFYGDAKYCYAARCEVTLSSTTGQTARIDGIDVRYNVATSGDPAQVQEEQRFSLDVVES